MPVRMPGLLRRYSFLVYFFILQLSGLIFTASAWAATATNPNTRIKVAVVELEDGKVKPDSVEKVADTLRDELSHQEKFEVIPKSVSQNGVSSLGSSPTAGQGADPFNRYLDQAKEFYKNFNFKEAINLLENTIDTYRSAKNPLIDIFRLTDAYLMLGNIQLGKNDSRAAEDAFREAVRLDPDRTITEMEYPPKTVSQFNQVKTDFLKKAKSASLELQSSPSKADVYINGELRGQTPLKLERFTTGDHFVVLRAEGYKSAARKIQLKLADNQERFTLEKVPGRPQNADALIVSNLQDIPEQVRLASALGRNLQAQKVVLVSLEEIGWNNKITGRMVDVKYQASHKQKSVEVLDLPKDTRSAVHVIAEDLNQIADLDLAKDPKKYADGDVLVIGTKKKKSFWKSPILWSLVGVVVAGGAASAFLLKGGSGDSGPPTTSTVTVSGSASKAP